MFAKMDCLDLNTSVSNLVDKNVRRINAHCYCLSYQCAYLTQWPSGAIYCCNYLCIHFRPFIFPFVELNQQCGTICVGNFEYGGIVPAS